MHWAAKLADLGRWVESVGMDSAGAVAQCLAHPVQHPDAWRSAKLSQNAASHHNVSVQQWAVKLKAKVLS